MKTSPIIFNDEKSLGAILATNTILILCYSCLPQPTILDPRYLKLRRQPRQQSQGTLILNRLQRLGRHVILFQHFRTLFDRLLGRVWEIATEQDVARLRKLEQPLQNDRVRRYGSVEVEAARILEDLFHRQPGSERSEGECTSGSMDEPEHRAAGVGEDDLAVRIVAQRAARQHVHGGAARLVRVVEHWQWQVRIHHGGVCAVRRVHEDDCLSPIQLCPNGPESFVAEVLVSGSVAGVQRHSIRAEGVERVCDFRERGFRVLDRGQGGEEAEPRGVVSAQFRSVVVALAGQCCGFGWVRLHARSWGRDGEDGDFDADGGGDC